MKVTIVVPVYNVEQYIEDCLVSIATQAYIGEIECIIVDDCTPDGSCDIIERFIKEYTGNIQFKLLHHEKNRGLSAARNTGIDAATGEYIYFLDSDDEITPDCIELLAAPLKNKQYDFVIGDYKTVGSNFEFPPLLLEEGGIYTNEEIRSCYFKGKWYMMAWNKLCNLDFIKNNSLYFKEGLTNEDNLWSFQLACLVQSMYIVKRQTYLYKIREQSIMQSITVPKRVDSFSHIFQETYNWSKTNGILIDKEVFHNIMYTRECLFTLIFSQKTQKIKKELYLKCYKRIHIEPWWACRNKILPIRSIVKEFYNYLPGILGYWYLTFYNFIMNR